MGVELAAGEGLEINDEIASVESALRACSGNTGFSEAHTVQRAAGLRPEGSKKNRGRSSANFDGDGGKPSKGKGRGHKGKDGKGKGKRGKDKTKGKEKQDGSAAPPT